MRLELLAPTKIQLEDADPDPRDARPPEILDTKIRLACSHCGQEHGSEGCDEDAWPDDEDED